MKTAKITLKLILAVFIFFSIAQQNVFSVGSIGMLNVDASLEKTVLTNQGETHEVNLNIKLYGAPSDIDLIYASCSLGGGNIYCGIDYKDCSLSGDEYTCKMHIPSIDYKSSPFYNPNKKQIILTSNEVKLTFISGEATRSLTDAIQDITIDVVPVCGKYGCESDLGENCCRDCGCPGNEFCYTGNSTEGQCISLMNIKSVANINPKTIFCTPFDYANKCAFTNKIEIIQALGDLYKNYSVLESGLQYQNKFYYIMCQKNSERHYLICPFILPDLSGIGTSTKEIDFFNTVNYISENVLRTKNLKDTIKVAVVPDDEGVNTYKEEEKHLKYVQDTLENFNINLPKSYCDRFKQIKEGDKSYCELCILCNPSGSSGNCYCPNPSCERLCSAELSYDCVCRSMPYFQNLQKSIESYKKQVLGIYSAKTMAELKTKIEKIRAIVSDVKKSMEEIKNQCKDKSGKASVCNKVSCFRKSGLESHEEETLVVSTM